MSFWVTSPMMVWAPNSSKTDALGLPTCQILRLLDDGWPDVQSSLQNQLSCKLDLQDTCFLNTSNIHVSIHQQNKSCSFSKTVSKKPSNMYSCPSPSSLELTRSYQPKLPNSFGVPKLQPAHKMFRTQIARSMTHFMPYRCQTHRMQQCWHGNVINRQTDSCVWDPTNKKSCRFVRTRDALEGKTCIILARKPFDRCNNNIYLAIF